MNDIPKYKRPLYAGESVTLQNAHMRVDLHKRGFGWGWSEVFNKNGDFLAVIEHLGEIKLSDCHIPMQLVADSYEKKETEKGESIVFIVKNVDIQKNFDGTKFIWDRYPYTKDLTEGVVTLTLSRDEPVLYMEYKAWGHYTVMLDYYRGPWVKVGQDSFGVDKDEALFPGIDWVHGGEWSSGHCFWREPWKDMSSPVRNKITMPIMAVSHGGTAGSLSWDNMAANRNYTRPARYNQPVFASPNHIERDDNHLLGLMFPSPPHELRENRATLGEPFTAMEYVEIQAQLALSEGTVTQAAVDYILRSGGFPKIANRRFTLEDGLHRLARAHDEIYWNGERFTNWGGGIPSFIDTYHRLFPDNPVAQSLAGKAAEMKTNVKPDDTVAADRYLEHITPEGYISFDPNGLHHGVDFQIMLGHLDPLGQPGDTALDLNAKPVLELLWAWELTKDERYRDGARHLLDYCMDMTRPDGGDYWETPLHAANLLAAGHAMNAYAYWYKLFGGEAYKAKAVHWIRTLLAFTHIWEPEDGPMQYFTKPCLCPSDYYHANWVIDHVQWEVLESFALSCVLGIDWNALDPELDWELFQEGVTNAAFYWMIVHGDPFTLKWHNCTDTTPDYYFADAHGTSSLMFSGGAIPPNYIAVNTAACLERSDKKGWDF